ncbi:MAG: choice-of-anchor Q domain-containing protein, partial [Anaerolineales bacterium]|nr:choice-of-anchor Q domain-containing protein [Anaerolineales bacterium]
MKTHSKPFLNIFVFLFMLTSLIGSVVFVAPVYAAPVYAVGIAVDSNADTVANDGACTLREAILNANLDSQLGSTDCASGSGKDTITFAANYTITLVGSQLPAVTSVIIINGNGAANTIIEANAVPSTATYRVFELNYAGDLTLDSLTVRNGQCIGACASAAGGGGGIYNGGGALALTNSALSGNAAIYAGGIYTNGGSLTVTNSTFSGNADNGGGGAGGIFNGGGIVTVTNSTFSANSANGSGGGINNNGDLTVTNSTFSDNSAILGGGIFNNGTLTMNNTILANSASGADCYNYSGAVSGTHNLIEVDGAGVNSCSTTAPINNDPNLGALADNGGTTFTMALLSNSPAIDAGDATICADPPVSSKDQRGVPRPLDAACDIGALESETQWGPAFVVNTSADTDDGFCDYYASGIYDCTLREALNAANAISGADTITFAADYIITLSGSRLPVINTVVAINGNGAANTIIEASACDPTAAPSQSCTHVNGVFGVSSFGDLTLDGLTVRHGNGVIMGGGVDNKGSLTATNSVFSSNSASYGGGIFNGAGSLNVTGSVFSNNFATIFGGGAYNNAGILNVTDSVFSGNMTDHVVVSGSGGGIFNGRTASILNSAFVDNSAYSGGAIITINTMDITNSTLSGNIAFFGGGIFNQGVTTVTNSTLSGNSAVYDGGGINAVNTVTLRNSIVANNLNGGDCYGAFVVADNYSFDTDGTCGGATQKTSLEINLGALADNGGATQTFALLAGSAAIDAGDDTVCAAAVGNPAYGAGGFDQRGVNRRQGLFCDIGAYELDQAPFVVDVSSTTADGAYKAGDTIAITVAFTEIVNVDLTGGTPQLTLALSPINQ